MKTVKLIKFPTDYLDNLQDYKHLLNNKYITEFWYKSLININCLRSCYLLRKEDTFKELL